jgi:hypothetical protein
MKNKSGQPTKPQRMITETVEHYQCCMRGLEVKLKFGKSFALAVCASPFRIVLTVRDLDRTVSADRA